MTFDHIMVDTETLGVASGCTVLSIGAVTFNPYTAERGPVFYRNISRDSCKTMGLTEDPATVAWWLEPERAEAWALLQHEPKPIWDVLGEFTTWWERQRGLRFWCQGASFDLPILEAAYRACALKWPWPYDAGRDTRTIYEIAGVKPDKSQGLLHGALSDAQRQAAAIEAAYRKLGLAEGGQQRALGDTARLDWLEQHNTEVRIPLVYGSSHLFFATVDDSVEGETGPSDIRAKVDQAMAARPLEDKAA